MHDKRTQEPIRRSRGRRGAGIEMAMLLMVVAVALSALLTSAAMMQIDKKKDSEAQLNQLERHMVLDQIGRDFCLYRAGYVLPQEVNGSISCKYEGAGCPGCCTECTECAGIYTSQEDNETAGAGTGENTEAAASRPECCADCDECGTDCTGFTEISLVAEFGEDTLTVELANNQDGTYTVTEWSYGE